MTGVRIEETRMWRDAPAAVHGMKWKTSVDIRSWRSRQWEWKAGTDNREVSGFQVENPDD